jgi:hypothetical protein
MERRTLLASAVIGATASILGRELQAQAPAAAGNWAHQTVALRSEKTKGNIRKDHRFASR